MFRIGAIERLRLRRFWRRNKGFVVVLCILMPLIVFVSYWVKKETPLIKELHEKEEVVSSPIAKRIHEVIVGGDYDVAINQLREGLSKNPDDISLKDLWSQLMDELKVDFKFHYLPGQKKYIATRSLPIDLTLTSKDPYYLTIHPSHRCYLYIFQRDSSGNLSQLFPNSEYTPITNPIPPGPLRIPDGFNWFYLDTIHGIETIYLVASRWEHEGLEELTVRIKSEKDMAAKNRLIEQLLSRLRVEEKATDRVPGLVFGVHQFIHR